MNAINFTRALCHERRFRIIDLLRKHSELNVSQLTNMTGMRQPIVSQHLLTLRNGGAVECRQCGTSRYYALTERPEHLAIIEAVRAAMTEKEEAGL